MRIYLIGFMGVGKTSLGKCLAEALNYDFIDTDEEIEKQEGRSINQIFQDSGEVYFRNAEKKTIKKLSKKKRVVISTGGGLPCYHDLMSFLLEQGTVIHIRLYKSAFHRKLKQLRKSRPLLQVIPSRELVPRYEALYRSRRTIYNQSHFSVFNNSSLSDVTNRIIKRLKILKNIHLQKK